MGRVLGLLLNTDFWLLWLVRSRADGMTWTPGLLMDYVCLLQRCCNRHPVVAGTSVCKTRWRSDALA